MTVEEFLAASTKRLQAVGVATARLDILVLLEDTLSTNRAQLLANPDLLISPAKLKKLENLIVRRVRHEPLAYIRNKTEFYGREFFVDQRVLEPRPESETMIDLLKQHTADSEKLTIIDVGTGSGALAITAKLEVPSAEVLAIDIDPDCLTVARHNARKLQAKITFIEGNLLQPLLPAGKSLLKDSALLCNLPYIPDNFQINTAATHEPRRAIFGGGDGLDLYRKLFNQLHAQAKPRFVLTEALPPQHDMLKAIAQAAGFQFKTSADFIQVFRTDTGNPGL